MSASVTKRTAKKAARLTNRLFSRKFAISLWDTMLCNYDFVDPHRTEDSNSELLVPMIRLALLWRGVSHQQDLTSIMPVQNYRPWLLKSIEYSQTAGRPGEAPLFKQQSLHQLQDRSIYSTQLKN